MKVTTRDTYLDPEGTKRLFLGMWECGTIVPKSEGYKFMAMKEVYTASDLRAIANKLDELNGKNDK